MKDVINYKEFIGSVHFCADDNVFFGKIEGINDLVTFEGTSVNELTAAFRNAVEDYLELCEQAGKTPFRSYKGSFNIRIPAELHKKAVETSLRLGLTLNQFVQKSVENSISQS